MTVKVPLPLIVSGTPEVPDIEMIPVPVVKVELADTTRLTVLMVGLLVAPVTLCPLTVPPMVSVVPIVNVPAPKT